MKKNIFLFIILISLSACNNLIVDESPADDPKEVFDYIWQQFDEKYSHFPIKDVNWDESYSTYSSQISQNMSDEELFDVISAMINELQDGHVNLFSPFNISFYDITPPEDYRQFDFQILELNYFAEDYMITGGFKHAFIKDTNMDVGYIRYSSFMNLLSDYDLEYIINRYYNSKGIIFDVRENGGGIIDNVFLIINHFTDQEKELYYSYIKSGPAENDFTGPTIATTDPEGIFYPRKIAILTDQGCYSATSYFAMAAKQLDPERIKVIGQNTSGGLGLPASGQLPNAWTFRLSVTKTAPASNIDDFSWENGVPVDVEADFLDAGENADGILEAAIGFILE